MATLYIFFNTFSAIMLEKRNRKGCKYKNWEKQKYAEVEQMQTGMSWAQSIGCRRAACTQTVTDLQIALLLRLEQVFSLNWFYTIWKTLLRRRLKIHTCFRISCRIQRWNSVLKDESNSSFIPMTNTWAWTKICTCSCITAKYNLYQQLRYGYFTV